MAVAAVNAVRFAAAQSHVIQNGIIPNGRIGITEACQSVEFFHILQTRYAAQNCRLVQSILEALFLAQSRSKGAGLGFQQLAARKGLHDRNANTFPGTPAVQSLSFFVGSIGIGSFAMIISGIDGEHDLVHNAQIQDGMSQLWRVGGKANMSDYALLLHFQQVVQDTVVLILFKVLHLIQTVDEAVIDAIRLQGFQHPGDLLSDLWQTGRPAIDSLVIVGPKMHLIDHIVPAVFKCLAGVFNGPAVASCQVHDIDPQSSGFVQNGDGIFFRLISQIGGSDADDAEGITGALIDSVFQFLFP